MSNTAPKPLTKSLHTVTAAVNVAAYLALDLRVAGTADLAELANRALGLLGYGKDWTDADPTFAMIVKQIRKAGIQR